MNANVSTLTACEDDDLRASVARDTRADKHAQPGQRDHWQQGWEASQEGTPTELEHRRARLQDMHASAHENGVCLSVALLTSTGTSLNMHPSCRALLILEGGSILHAKCWLVELFQTLGKVVRFLERDASSSSRGDVL